MTRHFGVLIPSTNTTAEFEYTRHLPPEPLRANALSLSASF